MALNDDMERDQMSKPVAESASPDRESNQAMAGQARPADPADPDDVLTHKPSGAGTQTDVADAEVLAESRRRTRRSFVVAATAAAAGLGLYRWVANEPESMGVPGVLRHGYDFNANVSKDIFRDHALAPTYPIEQAENLRVNGVFGLKMALRPESYRLQLVGSRDAQSQPSYVQDVTAWDYKYESEKTAEDQGHDTKVDPKLQTAAKMASAAKLAQAESDERHTGRRPRGVEEAGESYSTLRPKTPGLLLTLDDFVPRLPRHELVTQFKCIEGWSQIVHWAGVRMVDFLEMFPPALVNGKEPRYVYMETPDGDYYVGYDLHVCRHPQTLLVTEMMGAPLTQFHGAPLRMHLPTKYGYKQIKRIGLIAYTDEKPDDYWTKLGYDWYAGL